MKNTSTMKEKIELKKERYFIETFNDVYALEQIIKKSKTTMFQAVVKTASEVKRLTWTLLNMDVNFKREPLGSGITIFYIDKSVPFFLTKKDKK